jgi:hypothetical protein
MKKILQCGLLLSFITLLYGCKPTQTTTQTTTVYDEDITKYLTKYNAVAIPQKITVENPVAQSSTQITSTTATPKRHINSEMETILASLYEFSNNIKTVQGYRILVYSGTDREEALKIETDISSNLQERAELSYDKPNFRVRVGHYIQRLEAYKTYAKIRKTYPNAIIVLDKVSIESRRRR